MFCHPGKARIIARDPYSGHYVNGRGFTPKRARATPFTFHGWEAAIAHCRARGIDDVDFCSPSPASQGLSASGYAPATPILWSITLP